MNEQDKEPLAVAELVALLDRHGARPTHWPPGLRPRAEALLAASADARAALRTAQRLDEALDAVLAAPPAAPALATRIVARAPQRDAWLDWLASRLWRPVSLACAPLLLGFAAGAVAQPESLGLDAVLDAALEDRALAAFETDLADYELPSELALGENG